MGSYRGRLQIIADVLSIVKNGAKKTQIMYGANLSYRVFSRYLTDVLDAGLVSFGGDCYNLTQKGQEFLKRYNEYAELCRRLEGHLNDVNKEKTMLERMCFNMGRTGDKRNKTEGIV